MYTQRERQAALKMNRGGVTLVETAKAHRISVSTLNKWKAESKPQKQTTRSRLSPEQHRAVLKLASAVDLIIKHLGT